MEERSSQPNVLVPRLVFPADALARVAIGGAQDNLLRASFRDKDIELDLPYPLEEDPYPDLPSDELQLLINGTPVGEVIRLIDYRMGQMVPVVLHAKDRPYSETTDRLIVSINYRVTYKSGGGRSEDGPAGQQFITDIVRPGGASLAALAFSADVISKGVIPETLTTDPETGQRYLSAIIRSYINQSQGDWINGFINQIVPTAELELTQEHVGKDIELRFDEAMLKKFDGDRCDFSYQIEDRAGNRSIMASSVELPIEIEPRVVQLAPPRVPVADDGLVTTEDAEGGVVVDIPGHTDLLAGDIIWIQWNDHRYGPFPIDAGQVGKDPVLERPVPYDDVFDDWYAITGDTDQNVQAVVTYEVWRKERLWGQPIEPTDVLVNLFGPGGKDPDPGKPWHGALVAPSVLARKGEGPVNLIPADALDEYALATIPGMTATTPAVPAFRAGDRIQLYWDGTPVGAPVSVPSPGVDLQVEVPAAILQTHSPGIWDVQYIVSRPLATPPFENRARSPVRLVEVKDVRDLPGAGRRLGAVKWLAGVGDEIPHIDYDEIMRDDGTFVRIYAYENIAINDTLMVSFQGYKGLTPGVDPVDGTEHGLEHRIRAEDLVEKDDNSVNPPVKARYVDIHIPKEKLLPIEYGSATLDYTATNAAGTGTAEQADIYVVSRHPDQERNHGMDSQLQDAFGKLRLLAQAILELLDRLGISSLGHHPSPLADLPAPRIYDAESNGGLGYAAVGPAATRKISVVVGPWNGFEDGDWAEILWGATSTIVGSKSVGKSDANTIFVIEVEPSDIRSLGDGVHDVKVQVRGILGVRITSAPRKIEVKTTLPGGVDPKPGTPTYNENLRLPDVVPSPLGSDLSNVKVIVPRWDGVAVSEVARGDKLTVYWHGFPVAYPPLTDETARLAKFEVSIPEDIIRAAGGGDVFITYRIVDRVGNDSHYAIERTEDVPIDDPKHPQPPWVEGTENNLGAVLRLADLGSRDVTVLAENHGGKQGEQIRVLWAGTAAGEIPVPPFSTAWKTLDRDGQSLTFIVPNAEALPLGDGRVTVTYELKTISGDVLTSRRRNLRIEGKPAKLVDPVVEVVQNGVLDAAKNKSGATLIARHQPALIPRNSQVVFEWQGKTAGSHPTVADGTNDTRGNLPYAELLRLTDAKVRIRYVVRSTAGPLGTMAVSPNDDSESDWIELDVIDSEAVKTAPPPTVREAQNNRLDPLGVTRLTVDMPFAFQQGDTATVTWKGHTSDGARTIENLFPSQDSTVNVPVSILAYNQGTIVDVSYVVHRGGRDIPSETYHVTVEAIKGGDPRLPRPQSHQQSADGRVLDLGTFDKDADFFVAPWTHAEQGQRYWLTVEGVDKNGQGVTWTLASGVTFDTVQGPKIELRPLERSRLESLKDNSTIRVILDVTLDQSSDQKRAVRFRVSEFTIKQAAVAQPPAPEVVQASNGEIKEPWNQTRLQVCIPDSVVFQPGDQLKVQWNPGNGNASDEQIIPNPTKGMTVDMRIAVLAHNMGATVPVKYVIVRNPSDLESIAANVTIGKFSDGHKDLPRPQSPQQDNTGHILDLSQFRGDAEIDVEAYKMIAAGQRYWLTVTGTFAGGNRTEVELVKGDTIPSTGPGKMKIGAMDRTWLETLRNNSVINIKLWVSFNGSTNKQDAVLFRETDYTLQLMNQIKFEMPEVVRATDDNGDGIKESLAPEDLVDKQGVVHRIQVKLGANNPFIEGDVITLEWKGDSANGSAEVKATVKKADVGKDIELLIPYDVIRFNHGKRVEVSFSLARNGATLHSPILRLDVKRIPNQSTIWARGRILQEDAVLREIVLSTFTGDADLYTEPFPFVVSGMYFWIRVQSKDNQGDTNHYVEGTINSTTGKISLKTLPRTWLSTLRDNQPLTIALKVTFDGSKDDRDAVVFRTSQYTFLKTKPAT